MQTTSPIQCAVLFPASQQGTARITGDGSAPLDFQGSYTYQGGALVGKLIGDHPGGDRVVFGRMLLASERVTEVFAAEIPGARHGPDSSSTGRRLVWRATSR